MSKHHYASTLASSGHSVYFIEPPNSSAEVQPVVRDGPYPGLSVVTYKTYFPYALKFHLRPVFDALMRVQAKRLVDAIGVKPDVIWDFDNSYQFKDLRVFGAKLSIFHPVDDLPNGKATSKHADLVLSNAQRYINRLEPKPVVSRVIEHGLSDAFIKHARKIVFEPAGHGQRARSNSRPVVGYVGNLDRPGIDWKTIELAAERLPHVRFVFIGPFKVISDGPPKSVIERENIEFVGKKTSSEILQLSHGIDVWWMVYDRSRDIDGGTNPHKLLEYLATGSVVVSNWTEAYAEKDLVIMPPSQDNEGLPALLENTLGNLATVNSREERARRASYTLEFSYSSHLDTVADLMRSVLREKSSKPSSV